MNMYSKRIITFVLTSVIFVIIAGFLVAPVFVEAQQGGLVPCTGIDCGFCDFFTLINRIINWLISIGIALGGLAVVYAGILYVTSAGNESKVQMAKDVISKAVWGIGIMAVSYLIVLTILMIATGSTSGDSFLQGDFRFDSDAFLVVSCG